MRLSEWTTVFRVQSQLAFCSLWISQLLSPCWLVDRTPRGPWAQGWGRTCTPRVQGTAKLPGRWPGVLTPLQGRGGWHRSVEPHKLKCHLRIKMLTNFLLPCIGAELGFSQCTNGFSPPWVWLWQGTAVCRSRRSFS